jgi:hypothetical protein
MEGASKCLQSARKIIELITHYTDQNAEILPWWCLLHFIVCGEVIIMLTIVNQNDTSEEMNLGFLQQLVLEARKPLNWLYHAGKTDLASARTYNQLVTLLQHVEARLHENVEASQHRAGVILEPFEWILTNVESAGGWNQAGTCLFSVED